MCRDVYFRGGPRVDRLKFEVVGPGYGTEDRVRNRTVNEDDVTEEVADLMELGKFPVTDVRKVLYPWGGSSGFGTLSPVVETDRCMEGSEGLGDPSNLGLVRGKTI